MKPEKITLLIPNKLPALLQSEEYTQRITATLLLLKALFPAGRYNKADSKKVSELCGFESKRGYTNHITALQKLKLVAEEKHQAHQCTYINLASWDAIKKHFDYERNFFIKYDIEVYTSHRVMAILVSLGIQKQTLHFKSCYRANLNGMEPQLKEAIETVCGELSRKAIHSYQLKAFTEGLPSGMNDDERYATYMLLHATKEPQTANDNDRTKKRFYIKADMNISIGCLSRTRKYAGRNGMCYWAKVLEQYGLITRTRREIPIAKRFRTTTEQRATGIGNTFYDHTERCLKLRLTDEWTFISPEQAFKKPTEKTAIAA